MRRLALVLITTKAMIMSAAAPFKLMSRSFAQREHIPVRYTCDGEDKPPHLHWDGAPGATRSFTLICDDPDAPTPQPFVHWIVVDIPADVTHLDDDHKYTQGMNDFNKRGYGGPCPPIPQTHQYRFILYAVDTMLNLPQGCTESRVREALKGHMIDKAELVASYKRK